MASESEVESDYESNQHFAHLTKKDNLIMLEVIDKIKEQDFLIKNYMLEGVNQRHEKLKFFHASLVERYDNLSIEEACTINSLSYVAQLEDTNYILKNKIKNLDSKNEILQENHDDLLCSHEKFIGCLV